MAKKKTILRVSRKEFVCFMFDETDGSDGFDSESVANKLSKGKPFTIEDLMSECGYIPSRVIKNKKDVPEDLKDIQDEDFPREFEVQASDFNVIFI